MTYRASAARTLAGVAALSFAALPGLAVPAGAVNAGCAPNKVEYSISDVRGRLTVTHVAKARVPANTVRTFAGPVPVVRVVTSRFDARDAADAVTLHRLAQKAAAKARDAGDDVTLAKSGARTARAPLGGSSITFRSSPKAERYVRWHAYRVWDGFWSRSDCGPTGRTSSAFGARWRSFEPVHLSGASKCGESISAPGRDLRKVVKEACALAYR